jgi:hypothetical protein
MPTIVRLSGRKRRCRACLRMIHALEEQRQQPDRTLSVLVVAAHQQIAALARSIVIIRRSKTDQTGEGAAIVIPRGLKIRPLAALQEWLQAAAITEGQLSGPSTEAVMCVSGACAVPM